MKTLLPHQKKALDFAKTRNNLALFMEMRLGKTLTTIRWIESRTGIDKVLIVGPKSVLPGWEEELAEENINCCTLEGTPEERMLLISYIEHAKYFLINYEGIQRCPQILNYHWDAIVCDESTKIRSPKAQITKMLVKECKAVPYKAILSGYPCPESEADYIMQFIWLQGEFLGFKNYWSFREAAYMNIGYDWIIKPSWKEKVKEYVKQNAFVLTRAEAGLGSVKIYSKRYVDLSPKQKTAYKGVIKDFEWDGKSTKWTVVKLNWLQQIAGGYFNNRELSQAKHKEILSLLKGEIKNQKIVIWCKHTEEIEELFVYLTDKGFEVGKYLGSEKGGLGEKQILIAQAKCGMMGIDWSEADTAIYFSNWPDGEIRAQSEDRIIHPKKKTPVLIIDLITKDTIDEDVVELLRTKKLNAEEFSLELSRRIFGTDK